MSAQDKVNAAVGRIQTKGGGLAIAVRESVPQIARRLPSFLAAGTAERYAAIALSTIKASPGLAKCTPQSIVTGIIRAAEYGLALDGVMGHAYLVPYKVKGVDTAQFQVGYRGLIELMYRTGLWESVTAEVVREGDAFDYEQGTSPFLKHKRALSGRGDMLATYAIAYPKGGGVPTFVILDEDQVLTHRAASKAFSFKPSESIWEKHPEVAWRKSALRELSKSVAMATDKHAALRRAAVLDEQIDTGEVVDAEVVAMPERGPAREAGADEAEDGFVYDESEAG